MRTHCVVELSNEAQRDEVLLAPVDFGALPGKQAPHVEVF